MVLFAAPASAVCNYLDNCPTLPSNLASRASQFFSNATGTNFVLENFVQGTISRELEKYTKQKFNVDVKLFGLKELLEGKFKSITISANNVAIEGIHFSSLKIQTLCGFNQVNLNSKPIKPKENLVIGIWAEFSENDLRQSIEYKDYSQAVSKIDLSEIGISAFSVYSQTINIENNKLYFTINATPTGPYKPMNIDIAANLKVQDAQIKTSQFNFINLYSGFDLTKTANLFNSLNNLIFPIDLYGKNQAKSQLQIMNLEIRDNRIFVDGIVFIPKSSV